MWSFNWADRTRNSIEPISKPAPNFISIFTSESRTATSLEHVPEKLTDFSDQNMLQEIDFERILIDRMIPSDRNTL
jgi:hypothetical protein